MDRLHAFAEATSRWLVESFGPFGLLLVAFCDSSFLSLPEVNDILVVTMSIQAPERFWVFALFTTVGSVLGSSALHMVGKKGVGALLRLGLKPDRIESLRRLFRRYDVLAVLVPALVPPPCPFKTFVLASGAFGMSFPRFLAAITIGRSIRYFGEGWLAVCYGQEVLGFIGYLLHDPVEAGLLGLLVFLVFALAHRLFARWRKAHAPAAAVD